MRFEIFTFSKNRPCQLHALLESIQQNVNCGPNEAHTTIVYKFDPEYEFCYWLVESRLGEKKTTKWVRETNLREDIIQAVEDSKCEFIAFSTDDNIVYRKLPCKIPSFSDNETFSLRLGFNTIVQNHHTGELQAPLEKYFVQGNVVRWNALLHHPFSNYGYPFSLDLHIYKKSQILELIKRFEWKNSNELEGGLCRYRNEMLFISSFDKSVAVNIPLNNMSNMTQTSNTHTIEDLLQKYKENYVIDISKIDAQSIKGCHQDVPLTFRKFD